MRGDLLGRLRRLEGGALCAPNPSGVVVKLDHETSDEAIQRHLRLWKRQHPHAELPPNLGFLVVGRTLTHEEWLSKYGRPEADQEQAGESGAQSG